MSENTRKRTSPESHLIEEQRTNAPVRSWAGHVSVTGDECAFTVPGVWHLHLPSEVPATSMGARQGFALPEAGNAPAWREHLVRLVTLQTPGMQLRVRAAARGAWQSLELTAPTAPVSVVLIDRSGLQTLLGPTAAVELRVDA